MARDAGRARRARWRWRAPIGPVRSRWCSRRARTMRSRLRSPPGCPRSRCACPITPRSAGCSTGLRLPLAAPSANRSGAISPTAPAHVAQSLGGGDRRDSRRGHLCAGVESTIVALREDGSWQLLPSGPDRRGRSRGITSARPARRGCGIEAPGQLARHYSPGKPVRLNAAAASADEFMIGFGPVLGGLLAVERRRSRAGGRTALRLPAPGGSVGPAAHRRRADPRRRHRRRDQRPPETGGSLGFDGRHFEGASCCISA